MPRWIVWVLNRSGSTTATSVIPYQHRPYVTFWCALEDVNEENGTVYLLPHSRAGTREVVEHASEAGSNDKVGYHGDDAGIPVVLSAGGIAVFSSTTFHRSGPNGTDTMRPVLVAQFSPEPILNPDGNPRHWAVPFLKDGRRVACE